MIAKWCVSVAFCLLSLGSYAQVKNFQFPAMTGVKASGNTRGMLPKISGVKRISGQRRISLQANQRILGYYDTDDLAEYGLGIYSYPGQNKAGVLLGPSLLSKYAGAKVVGIRFGLCYTVGSSRVFVAPVTSSGIGSDVVSQSVSSTSAGWNTVKLDTTSLYTIPSDGQTELLVGFDYTQTSNGSSNAAYPLSVVEAGSTYADLLLYCNVPTSSGGAGESWYDFGNSYGNLSIQLIVQSDHFPGKDIVLNAFSTDAGAYKAGSPLQYTIALQNFGSDAVNYGLDLKLDGTKLGTYTSSDTLSANATDTISSTVTLPSDLTIGKHQLSVEVASIDGQLPTENLDDDTLQTTIVGYNDTKPRQKQLLEHFTSTSCTYCPLGETHLENLIASRNDIACASIHGIQNSIYPDGFNTAKCDSIQTMVNLTGWPSAAFNRTFISDLADGSSTLAYGLGYSADYATEVTQMLNSAVDYTAEAPSFATVKIEQNYDPDSRELNLTVSGEGVDGAPVLLGDDGINVYLTEDSLIASQLNQGTWISKYVHNDVLRDVLTPVTGGTIEWNGNNYENTYSTILDSTWNPDRMHVIAFIAPKVDYSSPALTEMAVNNCEAADVKNAITAGIKGVSTGTVSTASIVARYNVSGQRVGTVVKGLNIVKLSDGSVRKYVVK